MKINKLDQDLINKIAAGEVIERPASVVKELVENSIDAGASRITVELKEAGKSYIKVEDDGEGMTEKDAQLCIESHATSKIKDANDLFKINSLGFRGEALASIASVSFMTLRTKTEESLDGLQLEIKNGMIMQVKKIGMNRGTKIEVASLFYNTPARKKYLKDMSTELHHIVDVVTKYSLNYPNIYFQIIHNDKLIFNSPATDDAFNNIVSIYGHRTAKELIPVDYTSDSENKIHIAGYVSKPTLSRSDRSQQTFFVNNRYIHSSHLSAALNEAYGTLLMVNRYPVAVLSITLPADKIDVNVHPTKREIRFSNEREIIEAIISAVKKSFNQNDLSRKVFEEKNATLAPLSSPSAAMSTSASSSSSSSASSNSSRNLDSQPKFELEDQAVLDSLLNSDKPLNQLYAEDDDPGLADSNSKSSKESESRSDFKIIGQVNNTYIIMEDSEGISIVDQHVAEERPIYEYLMSKLMIKGIEKQRLVQPEVLELEPKDKVLLEKHLNLMNDFGFTIEEFGDNSFILRTLPVILGRQQSPDMIKDIIDEISMHSKTIAVEKLKEKIITRMACRASIMAGDPLTNPQMYKIIERLLRSKQPYTCPHGRPIMIKLSNYDLEKKFKRIV